MQYCAKLCSVERTGRKIQHYFIHWRSSTAENDDGKLVYFLFANGFEAPSIGALLHHYTDHTLDGRDFKLGRPILNRQSNGDDRIRRD